MSQRLAGKVAVITGGSSGIGRETALLFLKEGAKVVIGDINDAGAEETIVLANTIEVAGKKRVKADQDIIYVRTDVSKGADNANLYEKAIEHFGTVDIAFHNAGIMMSADGDAEGTEEEVFDKTIAINLRGVFLGCKYAIQAMKRDASPDRPKSIINTASFVAFMGAATPQLAYTASKGGVVSLTQELAVYHAREHIRVNALCPGPLHTELLMKFLDTAEKKNRRLVHLPMGRFGYAEEMAKAALFLASDESSYTNGAKFMVDGGLSCAYVTPEAPSQ